MSEAMLDAVFEARLIDADFDEVTEYDLPDFDADEVA